MPLSPSINEETLRGTDSCETELTEPSPPELPSRNEDFSDGRFQPFETGLYLRRRSLAAKLGYDSPMRKAIKPCDC